MVLTLASDGTKCVQLKLGGLDLLKPAICHPSWRELRPELVDEWTGAFVSAKIRENARFTIAVSARTTDLPEGVSRGDLLREKMTKKILFGFLA